MKIGIHGKAGSGKDSIGSVLAEELGMQLYAYANPLKKLCQAFIPELPYWGNKTEKETPYLVRDLTFRFMEYDNSEGIRYDVLHMINMYFLDVLENKETISAREVLQYVGTDIVRKHLDKDFWVNLGKSKENVVITDVRFDNELVDFNIKVRGGISASTDYHASEVEMPDEYFDIIVKNPFTLTPEKQIKSIVSNIIEVLNG